MRKSDPLKTQFRQFLSQEFYQRNTIEVAQDLLGKIFIVRLDPSRWAAGRIVETEAYRGDDPASHSARGETPRSSIMFGSPGRAYVYFIYGMYEMLNFVTEPAGFPGAVLIRAVEPVHGEEWMAQNRKCKTRVELTNGPGKLCRAMGIEMSHNGESLSGPLFYVADDGTQPTSISRSERVGIRLGKEKLWRFFVTGNSFVSRAPQNTRSTLVF